MRNALFWIIASVISLPSHASISVESGCYEQIQKSAGKSNSFFLFQSYLDKDLLLDYVGAFVRYNNSEKRIPLVFWDEDQGTGDYEGDYKRFWLEVVGKKVTGEYVEHGNAYGNSGGRYITYKSFKTNKITTFSVGSGMCQ